MTAAAVPAVPAWAPWMLALRICVCASLPAMAKTVAKTAAVASAETALGRSSASMTYAFARLTATARSVATTAALASAAYAPVIRTLVFLVSASASPLVTGESVVVMVAVGAVAPALAAKRPALTTNVSASQPA
jgi:hypothetical protein